MTNKSLLTALALIAYSFSTAGFAIETSNTLESSGNSTIPARKPSIEASPNIVTPTNKIPKINKIPKPDKIPAQNKIPTPNQIPQVNAIPPTTTIVAPR